MNLFILRVNFVRINCDIMTNLIFYIEKYNNMKEETNDKI